mgnify:CR=1 FL=1
MEAIPDDGQQHDGEALGKPQDSSVDLFDSPRAEKAAATSPEKSKKKRRKSNRPYPSGTFEDALIFARQIFDFDSSGSARKISFFGHINKSPDASPSRESITVANKYGLLEASYNSDTLTLTQNALLIVGERGSTLEKGLATIKLAITDVPLFDHVYNKVSGSKLPVKAALIDTFRDANCPEERVEEAIDIFIVNLRFSGLLKTIAGSERVLSLDDYTDSARVVPDSGGVPANVTSVNVRDTSDSAQKSLVNGAQFDSTCFYIAPIGADGSVQRKHSDLFLESLVIPGLNSLNLKVVRADKIDDPGIITSQIIEYIVKSKLVVADLSFHNPNVFYEMALRHAVRRPIVQIIRKRDPIPFDINQMRTIVIDDEDLYAFVPKIEVYKSDIASQARAALEQGGEADTPIARFFPGSGVSK